jgi:hypothetical protein
MMKGDWVRNDTDLHGWRIGKITRTMSESVDVMVFYKNDDSTETYHPCGWGERWRTMSLVPIPRPEITGDEDYRAPKKEPCKKVPCKNCDKWHYSTSNGAKCCAIEHSFRTGRDLVTHAGDIKWRPEGSKAKGYQYMPWNWISWEILKRDEHKCQWCGSSQVMEVHHIIPRRAGGSDHPHNLVTLCHACHKKTLGTTFEAMTRPQDAKFETPRGPLPGLPEFYERKVPGTVARSGRQLELEDIGGGE